MTEKRLNTSLVVAAWVNSIPDLRPGICATRLPEDNTTWGTSGFIVLTPVGGHRDVDLPVGRAIVQLDCYAIKPDTGRPLWNMANALVSSVIAATENKATLQRTLTLPNGYPQARVLSCYPVRDEKPGYGDPTSAAVMSFDVFFHWTGV